MILLLKRLRAFKRPTVRRADPGQSLAELSIMVPFLTLFLLAVFEVGQAFTCYLSLVNTARGGAVYASLWPSVSDAIAVSTDDPLYLDYLANVKADAIAQRLDDDYLIVDRPVAPSTDIGMPITVTVHYELHTFSSRISMPWFGRMGLPSYYPIKYSFVMPIRYAP